MSKHTAAHGGAQAKTGDQALPLSRPMGMSQTMGAMQSKTRSPANSAGGPNYKYQDPPSGWGDNEKVVGYEDSAPPAGTCCP
jgi:hypothetical protein